MAKEVKIIQDRDELLKNAEISLWLDTYDDIFSDFDPRPFSQRALSDDFLFEAKKASKDKSLGEFELKFLIPQDLRNPADEKLIKSRLKEHFRRHSEEKRKEYKGLIKQGVIFSIIGFILMILATIIITYYEDHSIYFKFLIVLLEPAGWFLFWEGLNLSIFESKHKKPEYEFYQKMENCEISFQSI